MPTQTPPPVTEQLIWFGTLREAGPGYLLYISIPILICVGAVLVSRLKERAPRGVLIYALAIILFALAFMTLYSIGILFFPAAVLLLAAAFTNPQESTAS
jgi:predicted MFS family arabinose efflux permease